MRVQMNGQSLRLRLQDAEFEALLAGDVVENRTTWPDGSQLTQQLCSGTHADVRARPGLWQFILPDDALRAYRDRLPTRESLRWQLGEGAAALELHFDVDVRDHVRHHPPSPPRKP
jgi:hypothetical protein